jgi:hypothetical protein
MTKILTIIEQVLYSFVFFFSTKSAPHLSLNVFVAKILFINLYWKYLRFVVSCVIWFTLVVYLFVSVSCSKQVTKCFSLHDVNVMAYDYI